MSPSDTRSKGRRIPPAYHRVTRRAATGIILLIVLVLAAATILWWAGGSLLSSRGAALLNAQVFGPGTRIVIADVSGFPFDHVILTGVRIERESPDGWLPIASARRIRVAYDLWGLLHGRYLASRAEADGIEFDLRAFPEGLFLPEIRKRGTGVRRRSVPAISIRKVVVRDAAFRLGLPWRTIAVDSLQGEIGLAFDRGLLVDVHRLRGYLGPGLGAIELTGGKLEAGKMGKLEGVRGTLGASPFSVEGPVAGDPLALRVTLEQFPLERLGIFLGEKGLAPGYVERVAGEIRHEGKKIEFTCEGDARWDTWSGRTIRGRGTVADGFLRLDDVSFEVEGTQVSETTVLVPLHARDVQIEGKVVDFRAPLLRVPAFAEVPGTVSGRAKLHIRDRKDLLADTGLEVALEGGRLYEIPFGRGVGTGRVRRGLWAIDSLAVDLADARLTGKGTAGKDSLDLVFSYLGALAPWRELVRQGDLDGRGRLRVRVHGSSRSPELEVRGEVSDLAVGQVRAPLVTLKEARGVVVNGRRFTLRFLAPDGVTLARTPFSRAEGELLVTDDAIRMERLRLDQGDTTVTASGSVRWEPVVRIDLDHAEAVLDGRRFWMDRPGAIVRDGDVFTAEGILVHTPRGDLEVGGSWNRLTRNLQGWARLGALDPSVFFPPQSPPAVAVGKMSGTVTLEGTVPALRGKVDLGLREIDWKGGHLDSLAARFEVADRTLLVDRLEPRLAGGSMVVAGRVDLPDPLPETLRALRAKSWPDSSRTTWDLDVVVARVALGDWRFLLPSGERAVGRVNLRARLQGTSAQPRLDVAGAVVGLSWRGFEVDSLRADATLADGTVTARSLETWQGKKKLSVHGTAPLDLVLLPFRWGLPERDMDVELTAEDGNLESLKLTPWIKEATGDLRAEVRVRGTPRHPLLAGEARVDNGRVSLDERDEVVSNITARFRFDRDLVIVEEAKGLVTVPWVGERIPGGWATATGTYRLGADESRSYQLHVRFDRALVGDEGTYAARVSGEVTLAPITVPDGRVFPMARGTINAERVEYGGSLKPQDVGPIKPPPILYDVTVNAPDRVYLSSEGVDAELGGELSVQQEVSRQVILGTLDVHRGTYQFFEKSFRVTEGTLTWQNPETRLPNLDIKAETKEAGFLITVVLTGRADRPEVAFSANSLQSGADAGLSQEQILQLLVTGAVGINAQTANSSLDGSDPSAGTGSPERFLVGAGNIFTGPLQKKLVDQLSRRLGLPVDEIKLENESAGTTTETTLGVTSYPTPEISLTYRQGLNSTFEQTLAVEYRLRRAVFLRGALIRLPKESKQEYNLDLKFRREY